MPAMIALLVAAASVIHGQETATPSTRDKSSPSDEQEFGGLIIRCPIRLVHTSENVTQNPGIKHQESYQADENGLLAGVYSMEAVEGMGLSLEGAAAGSIKKMSQTPGVTSLKPTIEDVTVSGIAAKRITYSSLAGGKDLYGGGLCVIKGQHIWIISLASRDAAKVPIMKAILDSARFHE